MVITLRTADGELQFSADETGWCDVELVVSGTRHQLGADVLDVLVKKLSKGLENKLSDHRSGTIEGVEVQWVLSLSERHCSVYAADASEQRVLFFQGADGDLIGKLGLNRADRVRWYDVLRGYHLG